ncbi:MAG: Mur ligase family protein, partial [Pirellulales bacterium]
LDGACAPVYRVVTDSRQVEPGDVFWALRGPEQDGADFSHEALLRGAVGVVSERRVEPWAGRWTLQVPHSEVALWELARWRRKRFGGAAVAIAGNLGKTITGRMINTVLRTRLTGVSFLTTQAPGALPLAMLAIDPLDDFAVFELAATAGQMEAQAKLCAPHVAILTGLSSTARDSSNSDENSPLQLAEQLKPNAWLVLPGDDSRMRKIAAQTRARVVFFGRRGDCDVAATEVEYRRGMLRFRIDQIRFCIPVWGRHSLGAVLAAFAVGRIFDLPAEEIAEALSGYEPPPSRCQVSDAGGVTFVDDSHCADATSATAALEMLREFDSLGRKIVVCGELEGPGADAAELHRDFGGQVVHTCGADYLVACGPLGGELARGAIEAGMPADQVAECSHSAEAVTLLARELAPGDVVLVKGKHVP